MPAKSLNRGIFSTETLVAIKDQVSSALGNETVILALANGKYFSLNEVASAVWNHIQVPRTVEQIRNFLLEEYCVEEEQCEEDLRALLQSMVSAGLIEFSAE